MILQLNQSIEVHFLFYVIANVIAFEVFLYMIYKVYRTRKLRLIAYNILLPLASLMLFETIISIMLLHSKFGLTDPPKIQILHTLTLYFIIIIVILFVSFIMINVILISPIIKKININLVPIGLGQVLIIFSVYMDIFTHVNAVSITLFSLGNILLFIIIYSGKLINAFLNIKGRETLKGLFIINSRNHKCIYHYDFTQGDDSDAIQKQLKSDSNKELDEGLFSYGIEGIENLISSITNTQEEKIKFISQGDYLLILEHGYAHNIPLTYVLIADKEQKSMRFLLNTLKNQFESNYKEILMKFEELKENQALIFNSFDNIVNNIID